MHFRNYGLGKPRLDKCVKSPVFEDPSKTNMVNGLKYRVNMNYNPFSILIDQFEGN